MFRTLKILSTSRKCYLFLVFSALSLEGAALFFQYGLGLSPCVMCVYERVALFGILFASLFGVFFPQYLVWRLIALFSGFAASIKGLILSLKHIDYQLHPSPWNQCAVLPDFPKALPLNEWFPALFHPTGLCDEIQLVFLNLTMVQWIAVMFAGFVIIFALLLLSQCVRLQRNRYLFTQNQ